MFWRLGSILRAGKCSGGGKVFLRRESVLEAGKFSGVGKISGGSKVFFSAGLPFPY